MPNPYTTVDAVLIATCHKLGDVGLRKYAALYEHAKSWLQIDYNPESGQALQTAFVEVGPDRVARLPDDFLDYVLVGRRHGAHVRALAHNPRLSPLPPVEPGAERVPLDAPVDPAWPACDFGWGSAHGPLPGYGWGEYAEEFVVDPVARTLRVSSLIPADEPLVLLYVSGDTAPHAATPLHPFYAVTLEYWCLWQYYSRPPQRDAALAADAKEQYYRFRRKAKAQLSPFSTAALRELLRQSYNTIR